MRKQCPAVHDDGEEREGGGIGIAVVRHERLGHVLRAKLRAVERQREGYEPRLLEMKRPEDLQGSRMRRCGRRRISYASSSHATMCSHALDS
jgi:hypothetical protein